MTRAGIPKSLTGNSRSILKSTILFVGEFDTTLSSGPYAQMFLERVWARGIPYYTDGAIVDMDDARETRDLVWTASGNHVVAIGEPAAMACRNQGIAPEELPELDKEDSDIWKEIDCRLDQIAARLPLDTDRYLAVRSAVFNQGFQDEWEWAQSVTPPTTAEAFAGEAIWIICCSGFRQQAARVTLDKVRQALTSGRSATDVFPKSAKGRAIDNLWANRTRYFAEFEALSARGATPEEIITWIGTAKLPFVGGGILRYHFAKNLGVSCAKPDRHMARLVGTPEDHSPTENYDVVMDMCRKLSDATGDKIGAVDVVLWRACNLGIIDSLATANNQAIVE